MRDIKFRGYSVKKKKFVYGFYIVVDHFGHEQDAIIEDYIKKQATHVAYKTVGQFTGLHDKNGVEVYEGDIVKDSGLVWSKPQVLEVKWVKQGWVFRNEGNYSAIWDAEMHSLEVIGNIYENPELLEAK